MATKKVSEQDRFMAWAATAPLEDVKAVAASVAAILRGRQGRLGKQKKPNSTDTGVDLAMQAPAHMEGYRS